MTNAVNDEVISKIEKLLALAESSNENEARLAANKAQELLTRYNLTVEQIQAHDESDYEVRNFEDVSRFASHEKFVAFLINKYFFVTLFHNRGYRNGARVSRVSIVGTKTNVKVATFVLEFLTRKFPEMWENYKFENLLTIASRNSYYMGLYRGLCQQFEATRKKAETETGLMIIKDAKLAAFCKDELNVRERTVSSGSIKDINATKDGTRHGKELKIARGVESKSAERGRLLR